MDAEKLTQMKRIFEILEMHIGRMLLRIRWRGHEGNYGALKKITTNRSIKISIKKTAEISRTYKKEKG